MRGYRIRIGVYLLILCTTLLAGCQFTKKEHVEKVGMLFTQEIEDEVFGTIGYKGLLEIGSQLNVDIYYRECVDSEELFLDKVKELEELGVNFIIGHGSEFVPLFNKFSDEFPTIHFVSMNGKARNQNNTNIQFDGYAMGFFGGMVASEMSKTGNLGVVAAYGWQSEVKGFIAGAKFQKPSINIHVETLNGWYKEEEAVKVVNEMIADDVDVFYPAGNNYNVPVSDEAKKNGVYAIGYLTDQMVHGEKTILTSTVQHVDQVYVEVAKQFDNGELQSGDFPVNFSEGVITMGEFSSLVPDDFQQQIQYYVKRFIQTGNLPITEGN